MANNPYRGDRNKAKSLLVHYFRSLAKNSGVGWDSDNESEIEQIVDLIIAAAVDEMTGALRARKDEGDEANEGWEDYKYRRVQAEAWAKAERGE